MSLTARDTKRTAGFTLLEIVMALFVMGTIALIFAGVVPTASKMAHMNGQYAQAASLCQHKIDQMRAFGFGRLTYAELNGFIIDSTPSTAPYSFKQIDEVALFLPDPTATINVEAVPGETHALKVTATITWKTARHQTHTSTMSVSALITD